MRIGVLGFLEVFWFSLLVGNVDCQSKDIFYIYIYNIIILNIWFRKAGKHLKKYHTKWNMVGSMGGYHICTHIQYYSLATSPSDVTNRLIGYFRQSSSLMVNPRIRGLHFFRAGKVTQQGCSRRDFNHPILTDKKKRKTNQLERLTHREGEKRNVFAVANNWCSICLWIWQSSNSPNWLHYSILILFSIPDLRCQKSQNLAHHYTEAQFWHDICDQHIDPRTNICKHPLDNAVPQKIVSNVLDFLGWTCGSTEGIRRDHKRTCQPLLI